MYVDLHNYLFNSDDNWDYLSSHLFANDFKLIISLLQNTRFKVTIIILALLSFMAFGSITNKMTIVDGIYNILTWNFFIMILLFLFLFNAYNIIT